MFVTTDMWSKIKPQFEDTERATLWSAITRRVFCPPGYHVAIERLDAGLADKFVGAIHARMRETGALR